MSSLSITPCVLLLLLTAVSADAAVTWEQRDQAITPSPQETTTTLTFPFTVTGKAPVKILSITPSCACLAATTERLIYQPDEHGVLTVVATFGDRSGLQNLNVAVTTDDAANGSTTLGVRLHLPELPRLIPAFVHWAVGETPRTQLIAVRIPAGSPFAMGTVSCPEPAAFSSELVPASRSGEDAMIRITPVATASAIMQTLQLTCTIDGKPVRTFPLYARVMAPVGETAATTTPPVPSQPTPDTLPKP